MGLVRTFRGLIKPTSFNITPSSVSVKIGTTYEIPYTILPEDTTNQKVKWTSSNTNIATVSNGIITPVAVGNATITGTTDYLGFTDTVSVEVYVVPVTGVSLNESSITVNAGETFQLIATITPSDAGEQGVNWSSSNTSVATVSSNGLVTYVGDGNATITATTNDGGYTASCSVECISFVPVDTCFGYTGNEQTILLQPHEYKIEVWGAQGGYYSGSPAGKGGYAVGCINITSPTCLYIYVGGVGCATTVNSGQNAGGYNGGGAGYNYSTSYIGPGGGGGTDVRIGGNTLYHRRIVAGGGGGGGYYSGCTTMCGGAGGGTSGVNGGNWGRYPGGYGGTQTSGGGGGGCYMVYGSFGQGGYKTSGNSGYNGSGGGGGRYGGGAGQAVSAGGGGGSGYVYTSSTCSSAPSGYCHCTAYYFTNSCCCCGAVSFPSPSGGTETGHAGCGCVRIISL